MNSIISFILGNLTTFIPFLLIYLLLLLFDKKNGSEVIVSVKNIERVDKRGKDGAIYKSHLNVDQYRHESRFWPDLIPEYCYSIQY